MTASFTESQELYKFMEKTTKCNAYYSIQSFFPNLPWMYNWLILRFCSLQIQKITNKIILILPPYIRNFLWQGWWDIGSGCPGKWMPLCWKCPKSIWAAWSSERCLCPQQGLGLDGLQKVPPTQTTVILWFYEYRYSETSMNASEEKYSSLNPTQTQVKCFFLSLRMNFSSIFSPGVCVCFKEY